MYSNIQLEHLSAELNSADLTVGSRFFQLLRRVDEVRAFCFLVSIPRTPFSLHVRHLMRVPSPPSQLSMASASRM